mgnify:CR=1 FL=1
MNNRSKAFKVGVVYVISSVMIKGVAFLSTPLFTRIMSTAAYGEVAIFTAWYSLLTPVCTLELAYSVGRAKFDFSNELDLYIGAMFCLTGLFSSIFSGVMILFLHRISEMMGLRRNLYILLIIYLFFTPAIRYMQNGYRYKYQYKQNIFIAWFISIGQVAFSVLFLHFCTYDQPLGRALGIMTPTVVLSVFFWGLKGIKGQILINKEYWSYGLRISCPLILHSMSLHVLAQSDRVFIKKICGAESTGIYSLIYTYSTVVSIITGSVAEGWLPWFHEMLFAGKHQLIRQKVKKVVVLSGYLAIAGIIFAPEAIWLLGDKKYLDGIEAVLPIVLGVLGQFIYTQYVNIEMYLKRTIFVSAGTIIAASINILLNFIFIPQYGFVAAAYTTLASYMILMLLHFYITRVVLKVHLYKDRYMFGGFLIISMVMLLISKLYDYIFIRYTLASIGAFSACIVYKDEVLNFIGKRKEGKA